MTTLLTIPNKKRRPVFAAKDIQAFYMDHAPRIFPQLRGAFGRIMRILRSFSGPCYDGKYLHEVVRKKLGSGRLHQTLTNVVKKKKKSTMDALLSDICLLITSRLKILMETPRSLILLMGE